MSGRKDPFAAWLSRHRSLPYRALLPGIGLPSCSSPSSVLQVKRWYPRSAEPLHAILSAMGDRDMGEPP
nr:hypothetical protein CFP56_16495 [Quercus suber]